MTLSWTSSESSGRRTHGFTHAAMACTWGIDIISEDAAYAGQAARAAFEEVDHLERELSRFIDTSDIARLNALTAGASLRLGPAAFECLEIAARVHADTAGAFDVTVGAAVPVRVAAPRSVGPPRPTASARSVRPLSPTPVPIGMAHLHLDRATRTVTKGIDGLVIDLGAIGKGYAVDQAVAVLRDWRVEAARVHSGQSTLFALGAPPQSPGWRIAVRNPMDHSAILGHVLLRDIAFSGSGTLLHGPHIIDPHTGRPAAALAGAWANAPTAAVSDAISTAFMVMEPEAVAAYCRSHPEIGALLCRATNDGLSLSMFGEMSLSYGG